MELSAEDLFDPVARDGLVEFFAIALHRDATRRSRTLHEMKLAWADTFRELDTVPPLTTASANGDDADEGGEPAGPAEYARARRAEAAAKAVPATPLAAVALSPFALSIAQQRLGIDTAGDLARVRPQHHGRLGHRPPDPPAGGPPGDHALGPPAARRDRPGLRPEPRRGLRRPPHLTSERESRNLTEDVLRSADARPSGGQ